MTSWDLESDNESEDKELFEDDDVDQKDKYHIIWDNNFTSNLVIDYKLFREWQKN